MLNYAALTKNYFRDLALVKAGDNFGYCTQLNIFFLVLRQILFYVWLTTLSFLLQLNGIPGHWIQLIQLNIFNRFLTTMLQIVFYTFLMASRFFIYFLLFFIFHLSLKQFIFMATLGSLSNIEEACVVL